jgi:hypothetical protein
MPATRAVTAPAAGVYRVARSVDVLAFHVPQPLPVPAPAPIEEGNRWDDAHGRFATVYCASRAEGAFGEVIARYRERPGLLQRIDAFLTGRPDPEYDPLLSLGVVPAEFFDRRWLGHVGIDPAVRFVDVDDPSTHAAVDATLRRQLRGYGVRRIDRSTFLSPDRRATRTIASRYHWLAQTLIMRLGAACATQAGSLRIGSAGRYGNPARYSIASSRLRKSRATTRRCSPLHDAWVFGSEDPERSARRGALADHRSAQPSGFSIACG